jgi:hypothetical protein
MQVDFSSGSTCEHGPIHFACRVAFLDGRVPESESQHDPEDPKSSSTDAQSGVKEYPAYVRFFGFVLRFFGIFLLVLAVIFWLIGEMIGHPLPSLPVVVALVGGAMYLAGRRFAPWKPTATTGVSVDGAVAAISFGFIGAAIVTIIIGAIPFILVLLFFWLPSPDGLDFLRSF